MHDPTSPPAVKPLSATDLKAMIDRGERFQFIDVRTEAERAVARIPGSRLLDQATYDELVELDPSTPMVFTCHLGDRSRAAAEHFRGLGFRNLFNVVGGIDAWSQQVDPSVPRY
jgi:monothiol glutaredoxin